MAEFLSPGSKVTQVRKGPVVLPGIATAIGGFLVYAQKGPVNRAIEVTSGQDAAEILSRHRATLGSLTRSSTSLAKVARVATSCATSARGPR